jgi:effector-binding domain-containing protein
MRMIWIGLGLVALLLMFMAGAFIVSQNVETPDYEVSRLDGTKEIRRYPAIIAAEVVREGTRQASVSAGFRALAGYIFAKSREGDKIAMTAPVTQSAGTAGWAVQFYMPKSYSLASLPDPGNPDVALTELPSREVAAIRFSGVAGDDDFEEKERELRAWAQKIGVSLSPQATLAYYNDPLTPGFLRRNEVLIPLLDQ